VKGDPTFDQFYASELESTEDGAQKMDFDNRDDLLALLQKIGPSILLTHSRSGPFGWLVGDARPDLVRAIVAVEPSGTSFGDGGRGSGQTLAFSPSISNPSELQAHREKDCTVLGGVQRSLPRLSQVPVLMLTGEASYHATSDHCTAEFLTAMGVKTDWIPLGTVGIHGNNHMMMVEKNNLEIAAFIDNWLSKNAAKDQRLPK
jgi:pimeloyl-ACP methyl ester carboxylesterase